MANNYQKVGIYVDVSNVNMNGGYGMRYDVLRKFACRNGGIASRLNAYCSFDKERADSDISYRNGYKSFLSALRDMGYKVIIKQVKHYFDKETGNTFSKANADLDLAVDMLLQSDNLDYVLLVTGDGDFINVVRAVQNKGCRVECLGFRNVSTDLKKEADSYINGFIVPELQGPVKLKNYDTQLSWGNIGSVVRGYCFNYLGGYGFMMVLCNATGNIWNKDVRDSESPYKSIFFHENELPVGCYTNNLPDRETIFEFEIQSNEKGLFATHIELV
jgi:uncharacterized LabA/DUF88 family protein